MAKLPFLVVDKTNIVDDSGKPVALKGVALGGWLMMEGYMMGGRNIIEKSFRENFEKALGREAMDEFTRAFRETFIREHDFYLIKEWGANCVRVPFNYRLIEYEDRAYSLNEEGLKFLDRAVEWCEKYSLYCILDLHAAPGSQNPDWHADCADKPEFFTDPVNQDRFLRLWHFLADRYKGSSAVAGYDVLNEPIVPIHQEPLLKELYEKVTREIRDVDAKHIIFLEGAEWASKIDFLGSPKDINTAYSIHGYVPTEFAFNWIPGMTYPGRSGKIMWSKETIEALAQPYVKFLKKSRVPMYIGEFGVNCRDGNYGEHTWVKDMLYLFEKYRFHWTYWTYKTIANYVFPDGIFRYTANPPWVNRKGPVTGWETFYRLWPTEKGNMISSWKTENFVRNDKLYHILKSYF